MVRRVIGGTKACPMLATGSPNCYAAFFCPALSFAQRAFRAAAIRLLPAVDIVLFAGTATAVAETTKSGSSFDAARAFIPR